MRKLIENPILYMFRFYYDGLTLQSSKQFCVLVGRSGAGTYPLARFFRSPIAAMAHLNRLALMADDAVMLSGELLDLRKMRDNRESKKENRKNRQLLKRRVKMD